MTPSQQFAQTRESLHALAEHVLAAARYHAMGRIGLRVVPGGFATPPFGDDHRTIGVDGTELGVRAGGQERRTPVTTTLRAAGEFADVEPGAVRRLQAGHALRPGRSPDGGRRCSPAPGRLVRPWRCGPAPAAAGAGPTTSRAA
jgi:hypothetical protein